MKRILRIGTGVKVSQARVREICDLSLRDSETNPQKLSCRNYEASAEAEAGLANR
jgi:hypothetical protein